MEIPNRHYVKVLSDMLFSRAEAEEFLGDDRIYAASLLLDAYANDNDVEDALQEFFNNSDVTLGVKS